jgi:lysophospholipase L1-like esterase
MGTNTNNQSCTDGAISNAPNVVTEGHGGYIVSCLTGDFNNCASKGSTSELATWMAARPAADVVLMHFGTNDVWNNIATATITGAYTKVLSSIRQANPNTIVFVAQILPMHPDGCTDSTSSCPNNGVKTLNAAIPAWASAQSTTASPIYVVNIYASVGDETAYVPNSTLTTDGVHPNAKGSGLVADAWMSALVGKGIP